MVVLRIGLLHLHEGSSVLPPWVLNQNLEGAGVTVEEPGHLSNAEMCVLAKGVFRDWGLEIGRSLEFVVAEACQHRGLITCLKVGGTL